MTAPIEALRRLEELGLFGRLESNASGTPEWPAVRDAIADCRQCLRDHERPTACAAE